MLAKVAFTMYPVRDAARARAFYEETLGLTVGKAAGNGIWTEYDLPGGGCFTLFQTTDIEPSSSAGGTIAFEVPDLDGLVARLEAAGVPIQARDIQSPVCRMTIVVDPEGNSIILHELKKS